jgi:hypothetical protein
MSTGRARGAHDEGGSVHEPGGGEKGDTQPCTLERLAYETALRALKDQSEELDQLRTRTGTLLAASSLTSSFLGAAALSHGSNIGTLGTLALVAFVVSILPSIYLLNPKKNLVFSISGPVVYESLLEVRNDDAEIHRRLAYWLEEYWQDNRNKIEKLTPWFAVASIALVIEIVLWVLALQGTLT